MEKISRIIPSNSRTKAIDVSDAQPVRPGAPTYGRPLGKVTRSPLEVQDRVTMSTAERAVLEQPVNYRDRIEAKRAAMVDKMAKNFFEGPEKAVTESQVVEEMIEG